ncbi:hypothetical protein [Gimesia fumaroli]|jgi:hypothetical protein|uniref:Uncharacterized protein n=1 Tax=Gimesia fumaroli TaxID=2527976 RepID=A0A518IEV1_9PLAN|nr:hypothetical protein [Gimesia fumaroli]QDV51597.1 hypothetical protein Enr17x_36530 [Gimesia fumaroli]
MTHDPDRNQNDSASDQDARLYVPINDAENINVAVKTSSSKEYCFSKFPGQDHFHLLMHGEIYVTNGHDMFCVECAIRHGLLTRDRLNWQHQQR